MNSWKLKLVLLFGLVSSLLLLVTIVAVISLKYYINDDYEVVEVETEEENSDVQSYDFGEFLLVFDAPSEVDEFSFVDGPVLKIGNNPDGFGSASEEFIYFPTEQSMSQYYQQDESDYTLSYPISDEALTHNKSYIHFSTDELGYSTGLFYDWEYGGEAHGYITALITNYLNLPENPSPFFNNDSAVVSSYCLIPLYLNTDNYITGYLVYSGTRSAGTKVNYCDLLKEIEGFRIVEKG